MEAFQEQLDLASKKAQVADHLLNQTYPLINDPKLLLSVLEHLRDATDCAITGLLEHELLWKRISPYAETAKLAVFSKAAGQYDLTAHVKLVAELHDIMAEHKKAAVEFSRKSQFVMTDESYELRTLSSDKLKNYLLKTKDCVAAITAVVEKNDRLSRRS